MDTVDAVGANSDSGILRRCEFVMLAIDTIGEEICPLTCA
jgi:hypothetical protein